MKLFTPVSLGDLALPHRVVMAPMTRNRATDDGLATKMMATYYTQRATAGLIVTEMTQIAPWAKGYENTPGLGSRDEAAAWRRVTDAVHAAGGRIVVQIAHTGRISHPQLLGGETPVGPSAIRSDGHAHTHAGVFPLPTPRALDASELPRIVDQFALAAKYALDAGFDGIELHAANGYLLDQFLRDGSNQRRDQYGGSAANRARLLYEVVEAVTGVAGSGRVGVRISPFNPYNSMSDSQPHDTFSTVAAGLRHYALAYLHIVDGGGELTPRLRALFGGPVIANSGYTGAQAETVLTRGDADAVSFASAFIANPDLPERLRTGAPLTEPDAATFYVGGARGYIDYPALHRAA
jgi:N-ethylmaleimide reductase